MELKHLGKTGSQPIEYMEGFPAPEGIGTVSLETHELECYCPVTKQPDIYRCVIEYVPYDTCVETKSLKMYLWHFREEAQFAEALACKIASDFVRDIKPARVSVTLTQNVRGGIQLTAVSKLNMLGERSV